MAQLERQKCDSGLSGSGVIVRSGRDSGFWSGRESSRSWLLPTVPIDPLAHLLGSSWGVFFSSTFSRTCFAHPCNIWAQITSGPSASWYMRVTAVSLKGIQSGSGWAKPTGKNREVAHLQTKDPVLPKALHDSLPFVTVSRSRSNNLCS